VVITADPASGRASAIERVSLTADELTTLAATVRAAAP
jgi:hypothetical protein